MEILEDVNDAEFESAWNEDESNVTTSVESTDPSDAAEEESPETTAELAEPEEEVAAENVEEEADAPMDYKALWETSQREVKTMAGRLKATETRLLQEKQELEAKVPPAPVAPSEEDQFLDKFREDYSDDVIKAIDILTARKAQQFVDNLVTSRFAPIEQTTQSLVADAHFAAIQAVHPDMDDIVASAEFDAWIESRPTHVKAAYQYVREQGTPAEAISLLNEYKQSVSRPQKNVTISTERVKSATAVPSRRGGLPTAAKPAVDDFESAWNDAPD